MGKKTGRKKKKDKASALLKDYDKAKSDHLEKLTDKMLQEDEKRQKLKEKKIDPKFLDLF